MFRRNGFTLKGFVFFIITALLLGIIIEFRNVVIAIGLFLLVFKIIHNSTYKNNLKHRNSISTYIPPELDEAGRPKANWLFRNSVYPFQFSLKCPDCADVYNTSKSAGNAICKNNHQSTYTINESLFSNKFELINENKDYVNQVFLETLLEILGFLSKGDGRVSKEEINYTLYLMGQYIDIENDFDYLKALQNSFRNGKLSSNYIENANLLKFILKDNQKVRVKIIEVMIEISISDGILSDEEKDIIRNVGRILGDFREQFLNERFSRFNQRKYSNDTSMKGTIEDCFLVLESKKTDSRELVKRNYFRLSKKYHPDQFASNSKEQKKAEEKMKQINSAWESIKDYFEEKR